MEELRELYRRPRERPVWELKIDGVVAGRVHELRIGHSSSIFYRAIAVHPVAGKHVNLEQTTDFDERVDALRRFRADPSEFSQHLV